MYWVWKMSCVIEFTSRRWNLGHNPSEWVLLLKNVRYKRIHNDFKTHDNSSTNDAENGTYPPFNTVTQTCKPRIYGLWQLPVCHFFEHGIWGDVALQTEFEFCCYSKHPTSIDHWVTTSNAHSKINSSFIPFTQLLCVASTKIPTHPTSASQIFALDIRFLCWCMFSVSLANDLISQTCIKHQGKIG